MHYAFIHEIPVGKTFSSGNKLRYKVVQQLKYNTLIKEIESGVEKNIPAPWPPQLLHLQLLALHNGFKVLMQIKSK